MKPKKRVHPAIKSNLHPSNQHRERYNFQELITSYSALANFVSINKFGDESIDFFNPKAVFALNKALLYHFYNIQHWELPKNALCPPIPGRADYLHYIYDLTGKQKGNKFVCLDIGTGANCIYPLLASSLFGWKIVGSDISQKSIEAAQKNVEGNLHLTSLIDLRTQVNPNHFFKGVVAQNEKFDVCICNPPFHASKVEAKAANTRKQTNLGKKNSPNLNFGGESNELWCNGGEIRFLTDLMEESQQFAHQFQWFSTLVSKEKNVPELYGLLKSLNTKEIKEINMGQGNKISRILAWRF